MKQEPTALVDWDKIQNDLKGILAPDEIQGPIKHRGEAETGKALWDLSLQQELAFEGSEGDKVRGLTYVKTVADRGKQLDALEKCGRWAWLCHRKANKITSPP